MNAAVLNVALLNVALLNVALLNDALLNDALRQKLIPARPSWYLTCYYSHAKCAAIMLS